MVSEVKILYNQKSMEGNGRALSPGIHGAGSAR
jgi:hypothetical protein